MARAFFNGVVINIGDGEATMIVVTFAGFHGDEKGLKDIFNLKGASGAKPCFDCTNVHDSDVSELFVTISCEDPSRFESQTHELFWDMVQHLKNTDGTITKKAFSDLEIRLGIKYNPYGLWYDEHLKAAAQTVVSTKKYI